MDTLTRQTESVKNSWKVAIYFEMPHSWHAGKSANLAIAGSFYCEILKAEEQQELFWLNPAACISGEVDKNGDVLPVAEGTLKFKVEAAFFSWVHVMVVPHQQLDLAKHKLNELKSEFPNRELPIIAVTSMRDLFFDRRVTLYNKTDAITHNFKKVWKRKYTAIYGLILLLLLAVIGRLMYGPIDRNPSYATFEGEEMHIRSESGVILFSKNIGAQRVNEVSFPRLQPAIDIVAIKDIDGDGLNEVLEASNKENQFTYGSDFTLYTIDGDTIWTRDFYLDIDFDKHPYIKEDYFNVLKFELHDIDNDGIDEVLVCLRYSRYFTSIFVVLDVQSGDIESTYVSSGVFSDFVVTDLDKDGHNEVILSSYLKGFEHNGITVLDARFLDGNGILSERYVRSSGIKALEKAVIIVPQTIVGDYYSQYQDWANATKQNSFRYR